MDIKLLSNADKKIAILAKLLAGGSPRKIAEECDVHYTTVIGYRTEQRNGTINAEVLDVAKEDGAILKVVAEEVKAKVAQEANLKPKSLMDFNKKVDDLTEGVSSLQLLDTAFHTTITKLLTWANAQITDDMSMKEWGFIVTKTAELHSAVFSKGTTVNLQQNNTTSNFSSGMVN